jgi:hypothetical protein
VIHQPQKKEPKKKHSFPENPKRQYNLNKVVGVPDFATPGHQSITKIVCLQAGKMKRLSLPAQAKLYIISLIQKGSS